ncbi:hypothetical protein D3C86_1978050 [compost metagenome]
MKAGRLSGHWFRPRWRTLARTLGSSASRLRMKSQAALVSFLVLTAIFSMMAVDFRIDDFGGR